jgi:hypothetical protein
VQGLTGHLSWGGVGFAPAVLALLAAAGHRPISGCCMRCVETCIPRISASSYVLTRQLTDGYRFCLDGWWRGPPWTGAVHLYTILLLYDIAPIMQSKNRTCGYGAADQQSVGLLWEWGRANLMTGVWCNPAARQSIVGALRAWLPEQAHVAWSCNYCQTLGGVDCPSCSSNWQRCRSGQHMSSRKAWAYGWTQQTRRTCGPVFSICLRYHDRNRPTQHFRSTRAL